jgi:hypothetical protein
MREPDLHMRGRSLVVALAALVSSLVLAACGSSGHGSSAGRHDPALEFAACMRSHGVPNFPDPSRGGGIQIPSGVNPRAPAFQAAQSACSKLLPGGGPGRGHPSASRKLAMLKLAECMRRHGISSFPDPTSGPPSTPPSGGGVAFGTPGAFLSVPMSLIQSPGFKQAGGACGFPGVSPGRARIGP